MRKTVCRAEGARLDNDEAFVVAVSYTDRSVGVFRAGSIPAGFLAVGPARQALSVADRRATALAERHGLELV